MRFHRSPVWIPAVVLVAIVVSGAMLTAQGKRDVSVTGRKYTYVAADSGNSEIRVRQGDLVTIAFSVDDIAHTFTINDNHYRIDRRAERGKPVTFKFLADQAGEFEIRCTLTADERCVREMRGKLIVAPKATSK